MPRGERDADLPTGLDVALKQDLDGGAAMAPRLAPLIFDFIVDSFSHVQPLPYGLARRTTNLPHRQFGTWHHEFPWIPWPE